MIRRILPLALSLSLFVFTGAALAAGSAALVHVRVSPGLVTQGQSVTVHARGFLPHERLAVTVASGHSNFHEIFTLHSETADRDGAVVFTHEVGSREIPDGGHEICVRGIRSHRVGCAGYYVQVPMFEAY
jgi:hypothetical protein